MTCPCPGCDGHRQPCTRPAAAWGYCRRCLSAHTPAREDTIPVIPGQLDLLDALDQ